MTSPDVFVADVNNFSITESRGRRGGRSAPSHQTRCQVRVSGVKEGAGPAGVPGPEAGRAAGVEPLGC